MLSRVGYVESKLRLLVRSLEDTPNVKYAHPLTKCFLTTSAKWACCSSFFMGLSFDMSYVLRSRIGTAASARHQRFPFLFDFRNGAPKIDLTPAVSDFVAFVRRAWDTPQYTSEGTYWPMLLSRLQLAHVIHARRNGLERAVGESGSAAGGGLRGRAAR